MEEANSEKVRCHTTSAPKGQGTCVRVCVCVRARVCDGGGIQEHFLEEVTPELKIRARVRRQMWGTGGGVSSREDGMHQGQSTEMTHLCSRLHTSGSMR